MATRGELITIPITKHLNPEIPEHARIIKRLERIPTNFKLMLNQTNEGLQISPELRDIIDAHLALTKTHLTLKEAAAKQKTSASTLRENLGNLVLNSPIFPEDELVSKDAITFMKNRRAKQKASDKLKSKVLQYLKYREEPVLSRQVSTSFAGALSKIHEYHQYKLVKALNQLYSQNLELLNENKPQKPVGKFQPKEPKNDEEKTKFLIQQMNLFNQISNPANTEELITKLEEFNKIVSLRQKISSPLNLLKQIADRDKTEEQVTETKELAANLKKFDENARYTTFEKFHDEEVVERNKLLGRK